MFLRKVNYLVTYFLNVSYFIEDGYFLLNVFYYGVLVAVGCDNLNPIKFACDILPLDSFHNLCYCCWLFYSNAEDPICTPGRSSKKKG